MLTPKEQFYLCQNAEGCCPGMHLQDTEFQLIHSSGDQWLNAVRVQQYKLGCIYAQMGDDIQGNWNCQWKD